MAGTADRGGSTALSFDPASYPGVRPEGAALIHRGRVVPVEVAGSADTPVVGHLDAAVLEPGRVRWCLAYGSNASPARLVRKGLDVRGAVLLPAYVSGWVPVFEGRRTAYGSVPLTLVPDTGVMTHTAVLGVHEDDLGVLDRSEGRLSGGSRPRLATSEVVAPPGAYELGVVGEVAVADRFLLDGALAYLPGTSTRVQVVDDRRRTWPRYDQAAAVEHLEVGGATMPAPRVVERVVGPWPQTPLADLPLLVYGTLQPDGRAWERIAEVVEVVGAATTRGRLYDSGHGWPAAVFRGSGIVRGTLVAAHDQASAVELLRRTDAYEAVPDLFARTTVRVTAAGEQRWAIAYAWNGRRQPGAPLPDGRWDA